MVQVFNTSSRHSDLDATNTFSIEVDSNRCATSMDDIELFAGFGNHLSPGDANCVYKRPMMRK